MASLGDWRAHISFSERLASIVKMHGYDSTAEYKAANPSVAPAEASQRAKAIESSIFGAASEVLDYQHQCNEVLDELRKEAKEAHEPDDKRGDDDGDEHGTKSIGHYTNARHFRDGLHSDVYKTTSPLTPGEAFSGTPAAPVALKVTYLNSVAPPHDSEREVRVLKKVVHKNIIPLWESFREPGYSHLVLVFPFMPYSLDMILRQGYIAEAQGRRFLQDLFSALKHVHELNMIHRDVKPSNILMKSPSGPVYLADFGIVWDPNDRASEPAEQKITDVGTTSYRAPEVLFGQAAYDQGLDMWAAGCVAAQVTTSSAEPLFNSGDVGSDLTLVQSIFSKLGTPTSESWPNAEKCPDWGKIHWVNYLPRSWSDLLPNATDVARDLISKLIVYQSDRRFTASASLGHSFFRSG